jgi:hypothetical protein
MSLEEQLAKIANDCVDELEPSLSRSIDLYADSTNAEIRNGLRTFVDRREKMRSIVSGALFQAIAQDRNQTP